MDNQGESGGEMIVNGALELGREAVAGVEHAVTDVIGEARKLAGGAEQALETTATTAIDLIRSLGAVHVSIGKFDINAELSAAKAHVEDAIIALARHVGASIVG